MQVEQVVAGGDQPGEDLVRQDLGVGTRGVAREAPVEVLPVSRDDERGARPERRLVEDRNSRDRAADLVGAKRLDQPHHRGHAGVLGAVHPGDHRQVRPVPRGPLDACVGDDEGLPRQTVQSKRQAPARDRPPSASPATPATAWWRNVATRSLVPRRGYCHPPGTGGAGEGGLSDDRGRPARHAAGCCRGAAPGSRPRAGFRTTSSPRCGPPGSSACGCRANWVAPRPGRPR